MPERIRFGHSACFSQAEIAQFCELLYATSAAVADHGLDLHARALVDVAEALEARLAEGA